jgi:hypothetical protein
VLAAMPLQGVWDGFAMQRKRTKKAFPTGSAVGLMLLALSPDEC